LYSDGCEEETKAETSPRLALPGELCTAGYLFRGVESLEHDHPSEDVHRGVTAESTMRIAKDLVDKLVRKVCDGGAFAAD
jgi:hypothetical protein